MYKSITFALILIISNFSISLRADENDKELKLTKNNRMDLKESLIWIKSLVITNEDGNGVITKIPQFPRMTLEKLANLQVLDLSSKFSTGDDGSSSVSHIVTDEEMVFLKPLKNLKELNLSNSAITDIGLVQLGAMTSLKKLNVSGTEVKGTFIQQKTGFKNLTYLNMSVTLIEDKFLIDLKNLKFLKELDLSYSEGITDEGLKCLYPIKTLKKLNIYGSKRTGRYRNKVSMNGILKLQETLKNCTITHDFEN